ncbi:MAG: PLP-dependent aminotransferase family protein [Thermoguttaceae bacterium]|nr:PLP-dependent aminotransferase family protein [Thermoguttaceae bacterium]MDW8078122.1 PLP-dependent aminotransferase family protein [Thermoguttaceae bacterium]
MTSGRKISEVPLSSYGRLSSVLSPVGRMMAQFAADFRDGVDINLGVGYVSEEAIPYEEVAEAFAAIRRDPARYRVPLNYGGPAGSPNLIRSLRRFLLQNHIGELTSEILDRYRIIIGASGASSLLEGVAEVLPPGIVITSDPRYYIYCEILERHGYEVLAVPEDKEGISPEAVEAELARLGDRVGDVRFFYVVTVNNPTCRVLTTSRRAAIVAIAEKLSQQLGHKVPVIFDGAYELLIHEPGFPRPWSPLHFDRLGIVYEVGTLSKIVAPALRIGFMIGPPGPLMDALVQHTCDVGFSAPLFAQEIASYLLDHKGDKRLEEVRSVYRHRALVARQAIERHLGWALAEISGGEAGFYYFLTFKDVNTGEASPFFRFLTRSTGDPAIDGPEGEPLPRVFYLPGEHCVDPHGKLRELGQRQLRISYAYEDLSRIEEGLRLMGEAARYAAGLAS